MHRFGGPEGRICLPLSILRSHMQEVLCEKLTVILDLLLGLLPELRQVRALDGYSLFYFTPEPFNILRLGNLAIAGYIDEGATCYVGQILTLIRSKPSDPWEILNSRCQLLLQC